jgi:hypothetical protein
VGIVHAWRDQTPHQHPDVQAARDCERDARAHAEAAAGQPMTSAELGTPGPLSAAAHEAEARARDHQIGLAMLAGHETHLTVQVAADPHAMLVTTDGAEAQARQRAARYAWKLLDANPDRTARELAAEYAQLDQPPHPIPAVLDALRWLAANTVGHSGTRP